MFAAMLRAAPYALFTTLIAAIIGWLGNRIIGGSLLAGANEDDMLIQMMTAASEPRTLVLIGIFSLIFGLIYKGTIESRVGGI